MTTAKRPIRLLTYTTLYPNAIQPSHGVFVENRMRHLVASGEAITRIVAPVPYFPSRAKIFGRYAQFARVPTRERRHGLNIAHPRYPLIPRFGMSTAPLSLYLASRAMLRAARREGYDFDVIDAHYFYPDGIAAILLGREFGRPVAITARGTDINLIPHHLLPRRMILWAAARAAGLITVSAALKQTLAELGVPADRIRVLRNGVDLDLFRPFERIAARARLDLRRTTLISVGNLVANKGHDVAIEAMPLIPEADLLIVGDGPEEAALRSLAGRLGLSARIRFLGRLAHDALPEIYSAADILVLASDREGWPNVLLEAMACGTPVVAAEVGGVAEVVARPEAGELMDQRNPTALAAAVRRLLARGLRREATRRYAEDFSWEETTRGQIELFRGIVERGPRYGAYATDSRS